MRYNLEIVDVPKQYNKDSDLIQEVFKKLEVDVKDHNQDCLENEN